MEPGALPRHAARTASRGLARQLLHWAVVAVTIVAVGSWIVFLRPGSLGGPATYVIVSGASMEPVLRSGDVVVALRKDAYDVGDLVLYRVPEGRTAAGSRVIHRIVGGTATSGYVLEGDNKDGVDPWRPTADDVLGAAELTVPHVGGLVLAARSPLGLAVLAGLTTLALVLVPARGARRRSATG